MTVTELVIEATAADAVADAPPPALQFSASATAAHVRAEVIRQRAAMPRPAPALPVIPVASEGLDYLRPGAEHSFVRDTLVAGNDRDAKSSARPGSNGKSRTVRGLHAGTPWSSTEVGRVIAAALGTTTSNPALVPPGYRPNLFVEEIEYPRPLVEAVTTAPIADATPFHVPRFLSTAGLTQDVAAEGVNPAAGVILTELVTITPKAVSGIYDASRELVDSSTSGVAIDRVAMAAEASESWNQRPSNVLAAELIAANNGTDVDLNLDPAAAVVEKSIRRELVALANRRKAIASAALADSTTFGSLVTSDTADGRPLLPYLAYGTRNVGEGLATVSQASIIAAPFNGAWAFAAPVVALVVRSDVYNFESPVRQLRSDEIIGPGAVRFSLFGYQAARVLRPAGVTRLTYTGAIPLG